MPNFIAFSIAGFCLAGFVAIWFSTAYQELSAKRNSLFDLHGQLRMHEMLSDQARDGMFAQQAAGMLETSRMLCREAAKSYNRVLRKPQNRLPALFMGFRAAEEQKQGETRGD